MKKLLASQMHYRRSVRAISQLSRKQVLALAASTFLMLVVVSEGIRLALFD